MKSAIDVSIVIVSYNSAKYLPDCLISLRNIQPVISKEIIVVDNASTDNSKDIIQKNFPEVILVTNKENIGFARANNLGMRKAVGSYILFLNPDVVVTPEALPRMMAFMDKNPDIGVIGPKLVYPDGSLQYSCRRFYNLRTIVLRRTILGKIFPNNKLLKLHLMSEETHNNIQEVDWVLAAAMMVRKSLLEKIGGFDEKYKLYFEDVDLCYRIKLSGSKVYYYPEATIVHYHQRESAQKFSSKTIWHIQSAIRFFNKFGWKI